MPPSSDKFLNYHPDLNKIMKNGPNHCPFCGQPLNSYGNSFARLECRQCPFNPEIYDESHQMYSYAPETYNFIDFYIEILDSKFIVECSSRLLKATYNPQPHVLSLPLNQFNINNLDALIFKIKTYILFS